MRLMPVVLVLALGACTAQADDPAPQASDAIDAAARAEPYDLSGQWSVSRIDGEMLDMSIPFTGSADALTWQPACAGQAIAYRRVGDAIEFTQPPRNASRVVCEIGYPDALPRVIEALVGRWDVSEQPNGNLLLARGDRQLVLEKAPAEPSLSLAGEWRVAGIDGRAFDEPYGIALSADESEIWWEPRCAGQSVRYKIRGTRFATPGPPRGGPASEPAAVCKIAIPPRLPDVMTAIRAADRIERTPANGVRISGDGHSLTLFSQ